MLIKGNVQRLSTTVQSNSSDRAQTWANRLATISVNTALEKKNTCTQINYYNHVSCKGLEGRNGEHATTLVLEK